MKVVINKCFGGFSVSEKVYDYLGVEWDNYGFLSDYAKKLADNTCDAYTNELKFRCDSKLVEAVEKLGSEANGRYAILKVVEIPDDADVYISDYDGIEEIHEKHMIWY